MKKRTEPKEQQASKKTYVEVSAPAVADPGIESLGDLTHLRAGNFFDYMLDMYAPPDQVQLRTTDSGWRGRERDAQNIRGYFQRAISGIAAG